MRIVLVNKFLYKCGRSETYFINLSDALEKAGHTVFWFGMIAPGEELNRIYNIAEATIVPSKFESFCLGVIESFSAGVPVLLDENSSFSFSESALLYTTDNFEQVIKDNILYNKEQQIKLKKKFVKTL
ncbi:glycosyltransferase [uncultured Eubacterium sp.]|uniref:glycosyltransferase n=1 Tax=uncultured Eubacterium sp. TaxID=165185 RepID=UPI0015BCE0C3|nr:glycosyltransferase [uncultured Eubacterium sp.]